MSMLDDYLDPDKHLWPDEPPCEDCEHDVKGACVLATCSFSAKKKPMTYHIRTMCGNYIGRGLKGYCLVASYANAIKFPTEEAACVVCTDELAESLKVFMSIYTSEEEE